jgi:hypothetical protein
MLHPGVIGYKKTLVHYHYGVITIPFVLTVCTLK